MQDYDAMDNIWIRPASPEATTRMVEARPTMVTLVRAVGVTQVEEMTAGVVEVIVEAAAHNLPLHSPR